MSRRTKKRGNHADFDDEDDSDFNEEQIEQIDEDEVSEEFEPDIQRPKTPTPQHSNSEEDEEEDIRSHHRKRTRNAVNYNEDKILPEIDDAISDDFEDDEIKFNQRRSKNRRNSIDDDDDFTEHSMKTRHNNNNNNNNNNDNDNDDDDDDDVSFSSDESESSIRRLRRRKPSSGFIVKDDLVADNDEEYDSEAEARTRTRTRTGTRTRSTRSRKLKRRKTNGRSSRRTTVDVDDDDDDDESQDDKEEVLTLQDELKDLQKDSPLNSPVQRNLRERKAISYTLPPPMTNDLQFDSNNDDSNQYNGNGSYHNNSSVSSPRRGRGGRFGGNSGNSNHASAASNFQLRRLFPTVGPFGGGDVHALFQNGGIPDGLTALGNAESSDSDDDNDLFKPTDPNDTSSKLNIITADMTGVPNNKKKITLADTDPLGIDTNIDFSSIGGLSNYIDQLKEMVTLPLLYPEIYSKFHITPPRGVLFHGPPGTGKTLMARALSASCSSQDKKITFFMRKGADCLSKWVGEAERHLRLLFEEAKQQQPSIIFFDEIDGLAPVRSSKQEQIHASIVSTLLALMDGMDNRGQVIVIGATNRPDSIDPALRRPGRFDREFYFPLPDLKAREEILKIQMKKWDHQLNESFIKELARLTKGYGGADLRALCTESALNGIQRAYPQIYKSNDKLKININKVKVNPSDFTRALNKIIPSSARSTSLSSNPLPENLEPLLKRQLDKFINKLDLIIPKDKPPSLLEESEYLDLTSFHKDGGFKHQQLLSRLEKLRVFKPRLLISGNKGSGQDYIGNAILHHLEGFNIQVLDFTKLYSDSSISPENLMIQMFQELKRHKPSVLYIPNILSFLDNITQSLKSTIANLVKNFDSNDRCLIFAMVEDDEQLNEKENEHEHEYSYMKELEEIFEFDKDSIIKFSPITKTEREKYFDDSLQYLYLTPIEFNDLSTRPKRKLKKLKILKPKNDDNIGDSKSEKNKAKLEIEIARNDMRLKNTLKIKLSGLMEIFKVRYKRFKKPTIDDQYLIHLFDDIPDPQAPYQRKGDKILELETGKLYHNIDLEVIEERLWNGYYSEPSQFLSDLEMILKDANTSGERDRILKANEMYANAQVGIEEIETSQPLLVKQWKEVSYREKKREIEYLKKLEQERLENVEKEKEKEKERNELEIENKIEGDSVNGVNEIGTQDTNVSEQDTKLGSVQVQIQGQLDPIKNGTVVKDVDMLDISTDPVEPSPQVEKMQLEQKVEEEEEKEKQKNKTTSSDGDGDGDGDIAKDDNDNDNDDDESSSSSDEEIPTLEKQVLNIPEEKLELVKNSLLQNTESKSVVELEKISSKMIELIWIHRFNLDKTDLVRDIADYIDYV